MKRKRVLIFTAAAVISIGLLFCILIYNGVIILNGATAQKYSVRGVDVSSYQGEIDWETLAGQDIQFAFIKATEGSSYADAYFADNYKQAAAYGLRVGAYHFFSYDSSGGTQADNFIKTVPIIENMLPPVVDVEFYGDKEKNPPDAETVETELTALLQKLEAYYGLKPILYATEKSYQLYIADRFDGYDIWIRNVITTPTLSDNRDWTFWQYTNRERLDGYRGDEKYIDMNVFYGSAEEFESYTR
ncbi:MAG TPA: GH25 family lysozyme [Oscillospiraceae bacterium]|nr:GH25 family lysozyme [Oscillospiraceae bacterium]HPF55722.1 GH25 family lysozyme [Clostridiales bacterium]HPK36126.1 GH25 family lysozyme [Oscillospiraceae bacterium]HPR76480.1 GH25 family lysozyme [Oscillospiraceae bacterium]